MRLSRPDCRAWLRSTRAVVVALLLTGMAGTVPAQKVATRSASQKPGAPGSVQGPGSSQVRSAKPSQSVLLPVSFQALAQAVANQDYTSVQLRRFRDEQGNVVAVREMLQVDADGTDSPRFAITFVGVEGELPGSPVTSKWQQTYNRYGSLFHELGSFQVRDLAKVQQNYSLHEFGAVVRAGRSAKRIVVFPLATDKAVWVIDVDATTLVPLYAAEFDGQFRLLAEIETETFAESVQLPAAAPTSSVPVVHADFATAKAFLGDPRGLIEPIAANANDYSVQRLETRDDPLNGQQRLIITYTDGVDQFLVVQTPGVADSFAGLGTATAKSSRNPGGHTIARYRDPAMSVLLFWDDDVSFQVAGRGSLERLDDVAKSLYLQAISTH